jgi:hypothetical protein
MTFRHEDVGYAI